MRTVLLLLCAALVSYELYALWTARPGSTITDILRAAARDSPVVPFVFGFIMGHLFWANR